MRWKTLGCCCAGTAPMTPSAKPSPGSFAPSLWWSTYADTATLPRTGSPGSESAGASGVSCRRVQIGVGIVTGSRAGTQQRLNGYSSYPTASSPDVTGRAADVSGPGGRAAAPAPSARPNSTCSARNVG